MILNFQMLAAIGGWERYLVRSAMRLSAPARPFSETAKASGWAGLAAETVTLSALPVLSFAIVSASKVSGTRQPSGRQVENGRVLPRTASSIFN